MRLMKRRRRNFPITSKQIRYFMLKENAQIYAHIYVLQIAEKALNIQF